MAASWRQANDVIAPGWDIWSRANAIADVPLIMLMSPYIYF